MAPGRIEVLRGCMFAGKTARLIERLSRAAAAGCRVTAFKHRLDNRYATDALASHDGRRFAATALNAAAEIVSQTGNADVIAIDEAQFFGAPLTAACAALRASGRRVIAAGIDFDVWGRPFQPIPRLSAIADSEETLHAACSVCRRPARFSQHVAPWSGASLVGGAECYEPRCERCFVPLGVPPGTPELFRREVPQAAARGGVA